MGAYSIHVNACNIEIATYATCIIFYVCTGTTLALARPSVRTLVDVYHAVYKVRSQQVGYI